MSQMSFQHPRVGVAAIVQNIKGFVLFGQRKGSHGAGTWALPGGHLELGESSFAACAERETLEETGLVVVGREVVAVTNDIFLVDDKPNAAMPAETQAAAAQVQVHKHYVTIFVRCEMRDPKAVPRVLEPEKCETWEWIDWRDVRRWAAFADPECRASANPGEEIRELFLPLVNLWKQCPGIEKALGQHD